MKPFIFSLLLVAFSYTVDAQSYANFTLQNTSVNSIPLWIPGVMNPKLSPFSESSVGLAVGQKVFFKYKGKKEVLLVVSEEQDKQTLNVLKLIKAREEELEKERKGKG